MNIHEIWEHALSYIRQDIPSYVGFNTYIKDITPISYQDDIFTVSVSAVISKNMITIRYQQIIEKAI